MVWLSTTPCNPFFPLTWGYKAVGDPREGYFRSWDPGNENRPFPNPSKSQGRQHRKNNPKMAIVDPIFQRCIDNASVVSVLRFATRLGIKSGGGEMATCFKTTCVQAKTRGRIQAMRMTRDIGIKKCKYRGINKKKY